MSVDGCQPWSPQTSSSPTIASVAMDGLADLWVNHDSNHVNQTQFLAGEFSLFDKRWYSPLISFVRSDLWLESVLNSFPNLFQILKAHPSTVDSARFDILWDSTVGSRNSTGMPSEVNRKTMVSTCFHKDPPWYVKLNLITIHLFSLHSLQTTYPLMLV